MDIDNWSNDFMVIHEVAAAQLWFTGKQIKNLLQESTESRP